VPGKLKLALLALLVVAAACVAAAALWLRGAYGDVKRQAEEFLWLLDENRIEEAHARLDADAARVMRLDDLRLVDWQFDGALGKSGKLRWAGTLRITRVVPLYLLVQWKSPFSAVKEPVTVTMTFVRRDGAWRVAGIWYDSPDVRRLPLLVAARRTESVDGQLVHGPLRAIFELGTHPRACAWTSWQGLAGKHVVTIRWIDPAGATFKQDSLDAAGKPAQRASVAWSCLDLRGGEGRPVAPGAWRAAVDLDGKTVTELPVAVEESPPMPSNGTARAE